MTIQRLIDEKDIATIFHQFRSKPGPQESNEKLAAFILENNGVKDWRTLPSQIQDKLVSEIASNAKTLEAGKPEEKTLSENVSKSEKAAAEKIIHNKNILNIFNSIRNSGNKASGADLLSFL